MTTEDSTSKRIINAADSESTYATPMSKAGSSKKSRSIRSSQINYENRDDNEEEEDDEDDGDDGNSLESKENDQNSSNRDFGVDESEDRNLVKIESPNRISKVRSCS